MTHLPTPSDLYNASATLAAALIARGLTLATAESCTGGLLSSLLTDVPGSSAYFQGGVISYSNAAKMTVLGVNAELIQTQGAVSAACAAAMAQGVRRLLAADAGIAITGIAGPGGTGPEKPVGLVYLHLSTAVGEWAEEHIWPHDRQGNKQASAAAALALLHRHLAPVQSAPTRAPRARMLDRPVVVEATWRAGQWQPQALWLQERRWVLIGWGRQTETANGGLQMLVEAEEGTRFELLLDVAAGQWRVRRMWPSRRAA